MNKVIRVFFLMCALFVTAPVMAYIEHDTAVLRIMNKAAGKAYTVTSPVGTTTQFEKLHFAVRSCKQTDPFQAEDFLAFVEISHVSNDLIFSNWMSRNEPGRTPLQNADYDVWLVKCE